IVFRTGTTGFDNSTNHVIEYSLKLESNPEFTSSVLVAFARAAVRLHSEGVTGCKTVFDIPPKYLSSKPYGELISTML
ncbi:MAG: diaminopimelate dehydrogenase, partial [Clostridia bacterium]|nr:diaminopimelate dehydrogenase [Clostridia bacterium]